MKNLKLKYAMYTVKHEESGITINAPEVLYDNLLKEKQDLQESLYLFGIDGMGKVLFHHVGKGGISFIQVSPADIFRPLLQLGIARFIVAHNHPSGNTSPSEEDLLFTRRIIAGSKLLGLELVDHLIFSGETFTSLNREGLI